MVLKYFGMYPIELDYLLSCKERLINNFKHYTNLSKFYKNFKCIVNIFDMPRCFRLKLNRRVFKFNNKVERHKVMMYDRFEKNLDKVTVDTRIINIFNDKHLHTLVEIKEDDEYVTNIIYEYYNKYSKFVIEDKLIKLDKDFIRKLNFTLITREETIDMGNYTLVSYTAKTKQKYFYYGDLDIVKYLYKIMRIREVEINKILDY